MELGIGEVNLDGRRMFTGTVCYITEQKRFKAALRDSEERMLLVTNAVPALIAYIDTDHHYRFVNNYYEDLHGIKVEDIVGKHIRDIFGEKFYQETQPYRTAAFAGKNVTFENEIPDKDGVPSRLQATYIPRFDASGDVLGYFVLSQDITERKRAEVELQLAKQ